MNCGDHGSCCYIPRWYPIAVIVAVHKQNSLATVTIGNEWMLMAMDENRQNWVWPWTPLAHMTRDVCTCWPFCGVVHHFLRRSESTWPVDKKWWVKVVCPAISPQHKISPFFQHRSNKNEKVSRQKIERIRLGLYYDIITQHTRPLSAPIDL